MSTGVVTGNGQRHYTGPVQLEADEVSGQIKDEYVYPVSASRVLQSGSNHAYVRFSAKKSAVRRPGRRKCAK